MKVSELIFSASFEVNPGEFLENWDDFLGGWGANEISA